MTKAPKKREGSYRDLKGCSVDGCEREHYGRAFCRPHLRRYNRYGDPLGGREVEPLGITADERFWKKVDKSGDCWIWTASKNALGYGNFKYDGRTQKPHRLSYLWANPQENISGLDIDHKCHNPSCVNPNHLQAVSHKLNGENLRGGQNGSSSGYRGVHKYRSRNCWMVKVCHMGKSYFGGYFTDVEEANRAAITLRNELYTNNLLDRLYEYKP